VRIRHIRCGQDQARPGVTTRRRCFVGAIAALLAAAGAASAAPAARAADCGAEAQQTPAPDTQGRAVAAVVCLVNAERERRGLSTLAEHPQLEAAGEAHTRDMVRRGFFAHTTPDGVTMADRLRASGFIRDGDRWGVGETLAWGRDERARPAAIVAAWLDSPSHRRVLLNPRYRRVGIGLAVGLPAGGATAPGATYAAELGVRG
jgi:uncharacterized protein YkwD